MDFKAVEAQSAQVHAPKAAAQNTQSSNEGSKTVKMAEKTSKASSEVTKVADGDPRSDKAKEYTEKEIDAIVKEVNQKLSPIGRHFQYKVHEVTKQLMIKVVDSTTNEVIKEIPPEKGQDAVAKLWELAGILVDEKR